MTERRQWKPVPAEEPIDQISSYGLLTERQAEAYVLRDIKAVPRTEAAEQMDISVNTLDKHLAKARRKVEQAEETIETIETIED